MQKENKTTITVRIRTEQYERLLKLAMKDSKKRAVSVGQLTRAAVEDYLEKREGKGNGKEKESACNT